MKFIFSEEDEQFMQNFTRTKEYDLTDNGVRLKKSH